MQVELQRTKLKSEPERKIKVKYKEIIVGYYESDILVENSVIVELKVAKKYNPADEAQLLNELKTTGIRVGILIRPCSKSL